MVEARQFRSGAVQELYEEIVGDDQQRQAMLEQEIVNVEAAQLIYDMRTTAGLTQRESAKRVGTTASVICRLENADYDGVTIAMLSVSQLLWTAALRFMLSR